MIDVKTKQIADLQLQISVLRNDIEELKKIIKDPMYYYKGAE